jgi:peptide deformylase
MKLEFVNRHHPILSSQAIPVKAAEIQDPKMQYLLDSMLAFARGEQTDRQRHVLVGLAAPQIGIGYRIILVDIKADGRGGVSDLRPYINPEIVTYSSEREEWYEGCYSTGDVKGVVSRPSEVTVRALDRSGKGIQETHRGYVARIFQHEIDHLNGIRFPERSSDVKVLHLVKSEEMPEYRNREGWRHWQATIPLESWKHYI